VLGQLEQVPQLVAAVCRERGQRRSVTERVRREQQVLHGREDRRTEAGRMRARCRVRADDDEDGRAAEAALDGAVHFVEEVFGVVRCGVVASTCRPQAPSQFAQRAAHGVVAHDDEHPRLGVLRARCMRGGCEDLLDVIVGDGRVTEVAARALLHHDIEELAHGCNR